MVLERLLISKMKDRIWIIVAVVGILASSITVVYKGGKYYDMLIENTKLRLSSQLIVAQKEISRLEESCIVACPDHDREMLIRWKLAETAKTKELNEVGAE